MTETRTSTAAPADVKRATFWKKLLFATVPCVVLFALVEIAFRLFGCGAPEIAPPSSSEFQEVELAAPDGRKSVYRDGVYVGRPVRTNERGFRDWLYETENREGALRVAGVGDSYTFGDGLTQDETWLRKLETKLAPLAKPRPVRTMNFGRRGANTADEAAMLEAHVLPYKPDLVVLGFTLFNDAETTVAKADATKAVVAREKSFSWKAVRWFHDHSHFVNAVSDRLRRGRKRAEMAAHLDAEYADDAPGWVECRAALAKFAETCKAEGVPLVVVIFPSHHRDPALNDWSKYDFKAQHDKVRAALAERPEVVVVDMAEHLADYSGKTIWIEGNGHPDAVYAQRVADVLAEPAARLLKLR